LQKALELDDTDVEANRVLAGYLSWAEWDWEAADKQWRRVFELDPNYSAALPGYAHFLMNTGRPDQAMVKIKQALELDPFQREDPELLCDGPAARPPIRRCHRRGPGKR